MESDKSELIVQEVNTPIVDDNSEFDIRNGCEFVEIMRPNLVSSGVYNKYTICKRKKDEGKPFCLIHEQYSAYKNAEKRVNGLLSDNKPLTDELQSDLLKKKNTHATSVAADTYSAKQRAKAPAKPTINNKSKYTGKSNN